MTSAAFDVDAFLRQPLTARLATNGPTVRPVWFLWEEGAFWVLTGPWTRLFDRVRADPVLRYRQPDLPRTFRTPWMPVVPAVGIVFSIWLITFLQWQTWARFAVWFALGLVVYFAYSYRRSEPARR
ncbi:amino acid permease C-terminal domain-containing protein [Streptomyces coeruleorubidus]|uniref:amino acid permease C-terminal domain-containing protein n=1 Tax=Streptomyces coeruleorubidus TaxID=116188 RepID=UPI0033A40C8A